MTEARFFEVLLWIWLASAPVIFFSLFFIAAPYGRYRRGGWGPELDNRVGWVLMEAPSPVLFAVLFWLGPHNGIATAWAFLAMWLGHYIHRSFIFPLRMRSGGGMPLSIALFGLLFNLGNAYLNARWLFHFSGGYAEAWLLAPQFVAGVAVFGVGFGINRWADHVLRSLRAPGETGYKIPRGGLYRFVSSPNYLGEIVEWCGWAIATWSLPGLAFALWTFANLAPRARAHHRWYHESFPEYPSERRALIPKLW